MVLTPITDQGMDDECFMALAEGLASLNMLEKLLLPGICIQVMLLFHLFDQPIDSARLASKLLKR
jgi:hypothetical protein